MCMLAIILTKTIVTPDVIDDSDLKAVFGYNNVSLGWHENILQHGDRIYSLKHLIRDDFRFV